MEKPDQIGRAFLFLQSKSNLDMINTQAVVNEVVQLSQKLKRGQEVLRSIDKVEVATTPKELVWESDKVKMYHYTRTTPATCKIPVLVSFAIMNRHDVLDLQPDRSLMKKLLFTQWLWCYRACCHLGRHGVSTYAKELDCTLAIALSVY